MSQFQENGAIYITKPKIYFLNKNELGGKISLFLKFGIHSTLMI